MKKCRGDCWVQGQNVIVVVGQQVQNEHLNLQVTVAGVTQTKQGCLQVWKAWGQSLASLEREPRQVDEKKKMKHELMQYWKSEPLKAWHSSPAYKVPHIKIKTRSTVIAGFVFDIIFFLLN